MAKRVGDLPSNIADNIVETIKSSSSLRKQNLKNLHPSISHSSKICLFSARINLLTSPKLDDLQNFMTKLFNDQNMRIQQFNDGSYSNELERIRNGLQRIKGILLTFERNHFDVIDAIEMLKSIDPSVEKKIENDDVVTNINLILFVDMLLQTGGAKELRLAVNAIFSISLLAVEKNIISTLYKDKEITKKQNEIQFANLKEEFAKKFEKLYKEMEEERNKNKGGFLRFILDPIIDTIESAFNKIGEMFSKSFSKEGFHEFRG